jgi:acyl carrier protein
MDSYPAKTESEKSVLDTVLAVYRQVLDDPSASPDDDFFELGGDSFQAMKITAMLEETTGKQVRVAAVFAFPTPAELAAVVAKAADASS